MNEQSDYEKLQILERLYAKLKNDLEHCQQAYGKLFNEKCLMDSEIDILKGIYRAALMLLNRRKDEEHKLLFDREHLRHMVKEYETQFGEKE